MSPPSPGAQSIGGGGDAAAFALALRENLAQLLKKHGLHKARLFFYGPYALGVPGAAVNLGRRDTTV